MNLDGPIYDGTPLHQLPPVFRASVVAIRIKQQYESTAFPPDAPVHRRGVLVHAREYSEVCEVCKGLDALGVPALLASWGPR